MKFKTILGALFVCVLALLCSVVMCFFAPMCFEIIIDLLAKELFEYNLFCRLYVFLVSLIWIPFFGSFYFNIAIFTTLKSVENRLIKLLISFFPLYVYVGFVIHHLGWLFEVDAFGISYATNIFNVKISDSLANIPFGNASGAKLLGQQLVGTHIFGCIIGYCIWMMYLLSKGNIWENSNSVRDQ